MKARDVMTSPVITIKRTASVREAAKLFLERHISGVPVVDDLGKLVGMVTEGDLIRRSESGIEQQRPWWLVLMISDQRLAEDYVKSHGSR